MGDLFGRGGFGVLAGHDRGVFVHDPKIGIFRRAQLTPEV